MLKKALCTGLMLTIGTIPAFAHKCETDSAEQALWIGKPVDKALEAKLFTLFACLDTKDKDEFKLIDATACNWFAGRALLDVWGFGDFKTPNGYLSANDMADKLASGTLKHWKLVGAGNDQKANNEAAAIAASKHPVIAAWKAPAGSAEHGHVALILPGGVVASPGWAVNVPRAAQLSLQHPNDAFIGCRISAAFGAGKKADVRYYSRDLDKN